MARESAGPARATGSRRRLIHLALERVSHAGDEGSNEVRAATIDDILATEGMLLHQGEGRHGNYYKHSLECAVFFAHCVASLRPEAIDTFGRLFAVKKQHFFLVHFSVTCLHRVQAMMNLLAHDSRARQPPRPLVPRSLSTYFMDLSYPPRAPQGTPSRWLQKPSELNRSISKPLMPF